MLRMMRVCIDWGRWCKKKWEGKEGEWTMKRLGLQAPGTNARLSGQALLDEGVKGNKQTKTMDSETIKRFEETQLLCLLRQVTEMGH